MTAANGMRKTAVALCLAWLLPAGATDAEEVRGVRHETAMAPVELVSFRVGSFAHTGGAIEVWGDDILVAAPEGHLILARGAADREAGEVALAVLPAVVPMKLSLLWDTPFAADASFTSGWVRVADILIDAEAEGGPVLYASHHVVEAGCIGFAVSRIALAEPGAGAWERVFLARPCMEPKARGHPFAGQQAGGKMVMVAPGEIWIAIGDHEYDGVASDLRAPVDDSVDLGKVIALDTRTGASRIVSRGLRNPQGLLVTEDGHVWETEHGPRGGDELNLIAEGANYGWPLVTLGHGYGGPWKLNATPGRHEGFVQPRFAFVPSVAPSALAEIAGPEFPQWAGDLVLATLKEKALYRLRREGDRIVYAERFVEVGARVRDAVALPDGRLALLTDTAELVLVSRADTDGPRSLRVVGLPAVQETLRADRAAQGLAEKWSGERLFGQHCATCHRMDGLADAGPPLDGIVGRPAGTAGFDYSAALRTSGLTWTPDLLHAYLRDPQAVVPGAVMERVDLSPAEIREIVEWFGRAAD